MVLPRTHHLADTPHSISPIAAHFRRDAGSTVGGIGRDRARTIPRPVTKPTRGGRCRQTATVARWTLTSSTTLACLTVTRAMPSTVGIDMFQHLSMVRFGNDGVGEIRHRRGSRLAESTRKPGVRGLNIARRARGLVVGAGGLLPVV